MSTTHFNTEQILESITGGFFALDGALKFTYWNRAAAEGTGLQKEEVLGKHIFEIFPNAEHSELGEKYKLALETKTFQTALNHYKDPRFERWFDFRIYPHEGGLSVFLNDITESKQQEQQRETLLKISHIINTAGQLEDLCEAIVQTLCGRYDLPEQNVLLYFHRPADRSLILIAPQIHNEKVQSGIYTVPTDQDKNLACVEAFTSGSRILTSDISRSVFYSVAPESIITSEIKTLLSIPLRIEHERIGVLEMILNVDRPLAEKEVQFLSLIASEVSVGISRRGLIDELRVKNVDLEIQRAQTQEAHEKLKRFLAFFSHELRAPLNSIIGFSKLITEEFSTLDQNTIVEYNTAINASGTHLLHLINDILDLSKIEAGKLELHYSDVSVRNMLGMIAQTIKAQADAKSIAVELAVSDEVDDIIADAVRIKQILINLVSNAIKFSHDNSTVIISAKRIGNDTEFAVKDFGVGIRQEEIPSLFQPFQQTASGARKSEGTGLGLTISKKLAELHGGSIYVMSEPDKGSTFVVRIPLMVKLEDTAESIVKKVSDTAPAGNKERRVLIVEDKPHARTILHTYLTEAGYVTEYASNGVEALEKAKLWKPDVITLDILLPVKDGWQVLRELKDHPLCKDIPVIIISMVDERNVGFGLGAKEYFVKPVQKDELIEAVRKLDKRSIKSSAKILVIDDDKSVTDLVQVILESEGCTVVKAHNGAEGLELAEKESPDLIILDLVMPELSGFNVAYQLKHNPKTFTIPVMIMTSMEIDDETREQLEGFVVTLMRKSGFTKRDLLNEIASIEGKK